MSKKKIRPGKVRLAEDEQALVVEYESEEFELLQDGSLGKLLDKASGEKKLKVKNLEADPDELAKELIEKCKLIKPASVNIVKDLLGQLKERQHALRRSSPAGTAQWSIGADAENTSQLGATTQEAPKNQHAHEKKSRREKMSSATLQERMHLRTQSQASCCKQVLMCKGRG